MDGMREPNNTNTSTVGTTQRSPDMREAVRGRWIWPPVRAQAPIENRQAILATLRTRRDPQFESLLHRGFPRSASNGDDSVDRRDF